MFMATQNPRWHLKTCMNLTSLGFWHQGRTNYLDGPSDDHPPPSSQMATHTRSLQTSHSEQGDDKDNILWGKTQWSPSQFGSFVVKSQPGVSQNCLCSQSFGWDKHQQPRAGITVDMCKLTFWSVPSSSWTPDQMLGHRGCTALVPE